MIGDALGAAASREARAAIEGLRAGFFPPTIHFAKPRPEAPRDPIASPRAGSYSLAMKTRAAFGGANSALIFGSDPRSTSIPDEAVFVAGAAKLEQLPEMPRLDLSALDRSSQWMTAVIARALDDAKIKIRRELADRAGLFAATAHLPWDATREFFASLRERGADRGSAIAFSRMVMNGPAGAAARMLSLRGASSVLAGGSGTTLLAFLQATLHLRRGEADLIAVASAEVADEDMALVRRSIPPSAAGAVILVRESFLRAQGLQPLARVGAMVLGPTDREDSDNADALRLVDACRSGGAVTAGCVSIDLVKG
jgi:3-oxoacyl-(acyl-carrier-protein) synthase